MLVSISVHYEHLHIIISIGLSVVQCEHTISRTGCICSMWWYFILFVLLDGIDVKWWTSTKKRKHLKFCIWIMVTEQWWRCTLSNHFHHILLIDHFLPLNVHLHTYIQLRVNGLTVQLIFFGMQQVHTKRAWQRLVWQFLKRMGTNLMFIWKKNFLFKRNSRRKCITLYPPILVKVKLHWSKIESDVASDGFIKNPI